MLLNECKRVQFIFCLDLYKSPPKTALEEQTSEQVFKTQTLL